MGRMFPQSRNERGLAIDARKHSRRPFSDDRFTISVFLLFFGCVACHPAAQALQESHPISRVIANGETHIYSLAFDIGDNVTLVADQQGIDIALTIFGPQGRPNFYIDRWNSLAGTESFSFIVEAPGTYSVAVRPVDSSPVAGRYTIQVTKSARPQNRVALASVRSALAPYNEAQHLRQTDTNPTRAISKYREALTLLEDSDDPLWQASTLTYLAEVLDSMEHRQDALQFYRRALPLWARSSEPDGHAETLHNIGVDEYNAGDVRQALKQYNAALPFWREAHDSRGEAATLSTIGLAHQTLGDYQLAEDYETRALGKINSTKDYGWQAHITHDIAMEQFTVGKFQNALDQFQKAQELSKKSDERYLDAHMLHHIGEVYVALGNYDAADLALNSALAQSTQLKDTLGQATALMHLGSVANARHESASALALYNRACQLRSSSNYRLGEAECDQRVGEIRLSSAQYTDAYRSFNRASALSHEVGEARAEAFALNGLAKVDQATGNLEAARDEGLKAIELIESLRTRIRNPELRASFLSTLDDIYQVPLDVLMQLSKRSGQRTFQAEAFEVNERGRARSLLDLLTESGVHIRQGVATGLLDREQALLEALSVKSERHLQMSNEKHTSEEEIQLDHDIRGVSDQLATVQAQIRSTSPQYAAITQPQPSNLFSVQASLGSDTLLLEYALGDRDSYLWAISHDAFAAYELPAKPIIDPLVRDLLGIIQARGRHIPGERAEQRRARLSGADRQYSVLASQLSRIILGPVSSVLGHKRLAIVADGVLQYFPFAILPDPSSTSDLAPLLSTHEVTNLPSASTIKALRQRSAGVAVSNQIAVFADPVFSREDSRYDDRDKSGCSAQPARDNPKSRPLGNIGRLLASSQEAEAILSQFPASASFEATGFSANLEVFNDRGLSQVGTLHLATHGVIDAGNPEYSGFVFSAIDRCGNSRKAFLDLDQIFNMHIAADLVVLSSCNTALGKDVKREGLIGLAYGFLYAGARTVVASLWDVDDRATAELMALFYQGITQRHEPPAAALRSAQNEMWKKGMAPYFWGGFVSNGEWR